MYNINFDKRDQKGTGYPTTTIHIDNPNLAPNSYCRPQQKKPEDGEWLQCRFLPQDKTFLELDGVTYIVWYCGTYGCTQSHYHNSQPNH